MLEMCKLVKPELLYCLFCSNTRLENESCELRSNTNCVILHAQLKYGLFCFCLYRNRQEANFELKRKILGTT